MARAGWTWRPAGGALARRREELTTRAADVALNVDTWAAALRAVDEREAKLLRQASQVQPADPELAGLLEGAGPAGR